MFNQETHDALRLIDGPLTGPTLCAGECLPTT